MIFRWLGKLCITCAILLLVLGVYLWLSGVDVTLAGGQIWYQLNQPGLQATQVVIERYLHASWFWTFFQGSVLPLPAWDGILRVFIVLMLLGGLLVGLFRKSNARRKKKGGF